MFMKKITLLGLLAATMAPAAVFADTACDTQNPNAYGTSEDIASSSVAEGIEPAGMTGDKVGYFVTGGFAGAMVGSNKIRTNNKIVYQAVPGDTTAHSQSKADRKVNQYALVAGYRMPKKPFVLGGEATYTFNRAKLTKDLNVSLIPASRDTLRRRHALAITALGGYPLMDRVMPFAKLGPTITMAKIQHTSGGATKSKDMALLGLQAGVGVEVAATSRIGVRLEGLYDRYMPRTSKNLSAPVGTKYTVRPTTSSWAVMGGLHFRAF